MAAFDLDGLVIGPCIAAFGEAAQGQALPVYTPAGGSPFALDGVFDEEFRELDQITGLPVSSAAPVFGVQLSQFPTGTAPGQSDTVMLRGRNFVVREVRPDGHGAAKLMLNLIG